MKKIALTQGKFAIVDNEDYPYLSRLQWQYDIGEFKLGRAVHVFQGYRADYSGRAFLVDMHQFLIRKHGGNSVIIHINHNPLDYRKNNLLVRSYGGKRQKALKGNKKTASIYKGVSFRKKARNWQSKIGFDKKVIYLGVYKTQKQAAIAYNEKARELYGEYAYQNKIK